MKHARRAGVSRAAVSLAALALLAGCATPSGSTAFSVDGNRTSNKQVDRAAAGCASVLGEDASQIRLQVGQFLLRGAVADAVISRDHLTISDAEIAAAESKMGAAKLETDPDCAVAVKQFVRFAVVANKVKSDRLEATIRALDVKVNPAYGTWDPTRAAYTGESGSLSTQSVDSAISGS